MSYARVEVCLSFRRRNASDRLRQTAVVEPVDPFEAYSTALKLPHGPRRWMTLSR